MEPATPAKPKLITPAELAAMDVDELSRDLFVKRINRAVLRARVQGYDAVMIPYHDLPPYTNPDFIRHCIGSTYEWRYERGGRYEPVGGMVSMVQAGLYIQLAVPPSDADN